ncbi:MAG: ABC transporter permease [Clostridia bacterium]|nr:ABC transporter permease [Clostridia bacterium]
MSKKQKNGSRTGSPGQLMIPLVALGILILFNLFRDPSFFAIGIAVNNSGNSVLSGNLISIIDSASALAIISMGMTLVTAACGGQDISVGAVGAIAGSFFVKVLNGGSSITIGSVILGIIVCCLGTILFMLFNGTLVSVFRIQPMIATLILFSCGRSIAYWINGSATPQLISPIISAMGMTIPGIPIPTPIFAVILMGVLLYLVFKFTNLRLYTQSVGINEGAARLNGVNPVMIKLLSFVLLGVCVSVAAVIGVCRLGQLNHKTLLIDIEMDAILAVAIGGNNLGGGKFRIIGSVLGAYIIQMLTTTLYAMNVAPVNVKAYKAIVIIIIVVAGSPVIKAKISSLITRLKSRNESVAEKEVA